MKRIITKMYLCLLAFCIAGGISAQTQNSMTEVIPFKTIDGKIIVEAAINGEVADFVLDLSGHNALLPEALKKLRIDTGKNGTFSAYQDFVFKQVPVGKVYEMATVAIGNNTFNNDLPAFTLEDEPYLRKLGVMGVLSGAIFRTSVLTIDMQRKKLTITQPYRPSYMKLNYRENFELITGLGIVCPISIQGKPVSLVLDTWSEGLVNLTEKDFNTWSTQYTKGTNQKVSNGYKEATQEEESLILPETMFVKTKIEDAMAVKNPYLKRSVLGKKILDYGIISIDYIHQKIYFQSFDMVPIPEAEAKVTETKVEDGKLISGQLGVDLACAYFRKWKSWLKSIKVKLYSTRLMRTKKRIYAITSVYRHCLPYSSYLQAANRLLKSELLRRSTYKSSKSNY